MSSSAPSLADVIDLTADQPEQLLGDGDRLVDEGTDPSGRLYVLLEGTLLVLKGETPITAVTERGSVVGEMSVLLGVAHSASVAASGTARVRVIEDPLTFLGDHPQFSLAVGRLLAKRLATVTSYLADIKAQFADRADHLGLVDEVLDALVHDQGPEAVPGSDRDPDPIY